MKEPTPGEPDCESGIKNQKPNDSPSPFPTLRFFTLSFLVLVATTTVIRIEVWNARAGGILPRERIPGRGNQKWREASDDVCREIWTCQLRVERHQRGDHAAIEPGYAFVPTPEEEAFLQEQRVLNRANTRLRSIVKGFGLLQYPLLLLALILSLCLPRHDSRAYTLYLRAFQAWILFLGAMMVYRGYFTSLGW